MVMRELFGDFRWWERSDCFSHPQCRAFVPGLDATKAELMRLFPSDVCHTVALGGDEHLLVGLFLGAGWSDPVDEVLQLGADLVLCSGWHQDSRLVAALRSADGYAGARFEVGVWAGLRRVGLKLLHRGTAVKAAKHADFVIEDNSLQVALELKGLRDPQRHRNVRLLETYVSHLYHFVSDRGIAQIILAPDAPLREQLYGRTEDFSVMLQGSIGPQLSRSLGVRPEIGELQIPGVGVLRLLPRDPSWPATMAGQIGVEIDDEWGLEQASKRVLRVVHDASEQLRVTPADVRVAVIWGSFDFMRAAPVAARMPDLLQELGGPIRGIDHIA